MGVGRGLCEHYYLAISCWCPECFRSSPYPIPSKCTLFEQGSLKGQGEEKQKYGWRHEAAISEIGAPTKNKLT